MTSITNTDPRTKTSNSIQLSGLACLVGGLLWLVVNIAGAFGLPLGPPVVEGLLGVLLLLGLRGGPLGLLTLRAAGSGRTGRVSAIVTLLGLVSYLTGQALQTALGLATSEIGIFYAAGALLVGLGMLLLGITVLLARRLAGWRRFAPLSVGLYYAAMIPVQIVLFIGPNGTPSSTLLAFWRLTWALLGYAILSEAQTRRAGQLAGIGG